MIPIRRHRAVASAELAIVFRSLATFLDAGMPIDSALACVRTQAHGKLRAALDEARRTVAEGRGLADSFAGLNGRIPAIAVGIVKAGERSGDLSGALAHAAEQFEAQAERAARLRQALAYPAVLLLAGLATVAIVGTVVVPKFAMLLNELGQELPASTRVVLAGSHVLTEHGAGLAVATALRAGLSVMLLNAPARRARWQGVLLTIPVIGRIRHQLAAARFCSAFAALLEAGVPLEAALRSAADASGDLAVAGRIESARTRVLEGQPVAPALREATALPEQVLQLLQAGEAAGRLVPMSRRASDVAGSEGERALRTGLTLLEPALIVVLGAAIAFVAAALLQAVYGLRPGTL